MSEQISHKVEPAEVEPDVGADVLRSLRRILRAVERHGRRLAQQHALTGPQFICLREIQRNGPMNPGQLARAVSLGPPTVTGILDRLEARGLVSRRRRHRDKRQVLVQLTADGVELLARSGPPLQERFVERLDALPERRRRELADALHEIVGMMEAEDIDAAPLLASGAANPTEPGAGQVEPGDGAARRSGSARRAHEGN